MSLVEFLRFRYAVARRRSRGLERFLEAQDAPAFSNPGIGPLRLTVYERACQEIEGGRKRTHWMWFVFPQALGLGDSFNSQVYGLSPNEARQYAEHPVLSARLRRATDLVVEQLKLGRTLHELFGEVDAMKFASCMDLFAQVDPDGYGETQHLVRAPQLERSR